MSSNNATEIKVGSVNLCLPLSRLPLSDSVHDTAASIAEHSSPYLKRLPKTSNDQSGNSLIRTKVYPQHPHSSSTFSQNKNEEYEFEKPQECPVFRPNEDEFKNPLTYINKIRPIAEKYGIARILPPKTWTPPFTVDVDKLKFTPRVQRLNELEAKTRVKLNFLDQIAKFWELQGSSLKIPMVERKALDLYSLHRIVQKEGGIEQTTKERKWSKVAQRMHYPSGKSIGAILKGHYERILHPFDIYTSGKVIDIKLEPKSGDKDYKPHGIVSRQQITPPNETTARRSKRFANMSASKESACGLGTVSANIKSECEDEKRNKIPTSKPGRNHFFRPATPSAVNNDPLAKYICHICNRGDVEEAMLLCDGCDDSYHTFCLLPPLNDIPKGDWRCPRCVVEEVSKPTEAFGFEQAQREYTLQQFGEMADRFKADYFRRPVHLISTEIVEREFWRIVSSIDEDVTVEYGADLHTMDHGSGFPTKSSLYLLAGDQEYAESNWNLNNLPLLEDSILGHINADISGMKVPWMYVGMCFATFCWHNEDHWSYSINYLHWGEPKTWYGVPGSCAETFEKTMKSAAPELFASQPDLLHQLVTIMNPNILMKSGVPVYRTDQHAGEFVITFPRAYHAGFNQGYNFAEAVNFAPADWLKMGRDCINHYSTLRRFCVFSHDELVCKMALEPDKLNFAIATACYVDMVKMVDSEKKLRKSLLEWGVTKAEREAFELIPDDERQCDVCKTTCFLSAVSCQCTKQIVCLRHYTKLCDCNPNNHSLQYRYTLDEMPLMLKKLQNKALSFELWLKKCRDVIEPPVFEHKITLEDLQELVLEAERNKYPNSILIDRLNSAVLEAEKCVTVIQQLDINKVRTRTRHSNESSNYKLTMDELELFVEEIDNLCCIIKEGQSVRELFGFAKTFVSSAQNLLKKKINKLNEKLIEKLIGKGQSLCIELRELKNLRLRFEQVSWYNRSRRFRNSNTKLQIADLNRYIKEGMTLVPEPLIEKELSVLQGIVVSVESWEKAAKSCFQANSQRDLPEIELILEAADKMQAETPSKPALKEALRKTRDWLSIVDTLQKNEHYPYCHTIKSVVNRGLNIPFKLEELECMKKQLDAAYEWKEKTRKEFLRKNTQFTLLEVLSPRSSAIMMEGNDTVRNTLQEHFTENLSPSQMVDAFKKAEEKETREMREIRRINSNLNPLEDKFCFCKQSFFGTMYLCQLCLNWFHKKCVPAPSQKETTLKTQNCLTAKSHKFLCSSCMRSRRPRLETILSLLVSLQRLPIRLPEGEALQCLTERAMNWQDRARQALLTEDVVVALAKLSDECQKTHTRSITCVTLGTELLTQKENVKIIDGYQTDSDVENDISSVEEYSKILSPTSQDGKETQTKNVFPSCRDEQIKNNLIPFKTDDHRGNSLESNILQPTDLVENETEHAYSVPTLVAQIFCDNVEDDKAISNELSPSVNVKLRKSTKEALENLMLEGDLLEVTLDETNQIWNILNAAENMNDSEKMTKIMPKPSESNETTTSRTPKKRQVTDTNVSPLTKRMRKDSEHNRKYSVKRDKKQKDKLPEGDISNFKSTPSGGINSVKKGKRVTKLSGRHVISTISSVSDDDEECRAQNCHKPTGREVDWVQCDGGCNEWFHMFCVGLDRKQIKPDDDYICKRCVQSNSEPIIAVQQEALPSCLEASVYTLAEESDKVIVSPSDFSILETTPKNVSYTLPTKSTKSNKET